ncbi:single-stranded-DNA-specific exonuclease RecJ [Candidatus Nomurabacteria bacterium]|nr:single-stranded-DNA-specific exonuclease RecJ [Candidatus Nomurabacteria bacterium]
MTNNWQIISEVDQELAENFPELDPIIVQLLANRGLKTQEEIDEFLYPDYSRDIHDPFLFKDMKKACQRLFEAIKEQEQITVFGDYDADGVSSATILSTILEKLGAKVDVYLPHREKEGYGLNQNAVAEIAKTGTKIIISCDCGISNTAEVKTANDLGLEVIITDHHAIPEKLPEALAIIHPQIEGEQYPFKYLAGGGVAFKLAQALIKSSDLDQAEKEKTEKWLLDLVAISTVADMVPLLGENRTLVKYGLIVLQKTKRIGLRAMIKAAGIDPEKIDAVTIGFAIAPRINAAGRMDHANLAFYLLKETEEIKANTLAEELNQQNVQRQRLTEQIVKEAKQKPIDLKQSLFIFYQEDWPAGLTGLVASRLLREYNRPCFVLTKTEDGNIVGSARSIKEFDISKALKANEQFLKRFGGHPQAGGFAMDPEHLEALTASLQKSANEQLKDQDLSAILEIELAVDFEKINWSLLDILDQFSPFGQKNPEPLFISKDILITDLKKVGKDQSHLKLQLVKKDKKLGAIAFGLAKLDLAIGQRIDIVYNLSINQWNGNREIQLMIKDIKLSTSSS